MTRNVFIAERAATNGSDNEEGPDGKHQVLVTMYVKF